ncbi:hypothetical protein LA6_001470 [Marinibacterium anthonyi]|nr:hypothetical protein LA6_001470 [Marinibacterium anthonyi]
MSEVLLHVGMDKTGSSSIQHSFAGYDDGTLAYAKLASANHSMPLQMVFRDPEEPTRAVRAQGIGREGILEQREKHRADLTAALKGPRERLLISAEGVLSLKADQVADLRDTLLSHRDKVRVLAYVREPMGYASSAFQQGLKSGTRNFHVPMPRYTRRLGTLDTVFGAENVTFLRFDPASFPDRSVTQDFAAHIGADVSRLDEQRSNESLSVEAAAALFLFNRERPDLTGSRELFQARIVLVRLLMQEENRRIQRIAKRIKRRLGLGTARRRPPAQAKTEKFRFSPSLVRAQIPKDDIEWMEKRAGLSLMPPETDASDTPEPGIHSEEHLLDVAASAADKFLMPFVDRLKLKPADRSTLAIMDAMFAYAKSKNGRR